MTVHIYSNPDEITSPKWAAAFQKGCPVPSEIHTDDEIREGTHAGFGSPAYWQSTVAAIKRKDDWYYGDHGYFGRKLFYRCTKNGFQPDGITGRPNFNKLRMFHQEAKPFKKQGSHILICLQSENYQHRMGSPLPDYLDSLIHRIRLYSDRQIVVRTKKSDVPFQKHLGNSWAVVTHSSACALHALLEGIPAFTTGDSGVGHLTLRDPINIERPYYPDADLRFCTAGILAANQWTLEEMANGDAWRKCNETV